MSVIEVCFLIIYEFYLSFEVARCCAAGAVSRVRRAMKPRTFRSLFFLVLYFPQLGYVSHMSCVVSILAHLSANAVLENAGVIKYRTCSAGSYERKRLWTYSTILERV